MRKGKRSKQEVTPQDAFKYSVFLKTIKVNEFWMNSLKLLEPEIVKEKKLEKCEGQANEIYVSLKPSNHIHNSQKLTL